jgi:serine/threonine protein kinase
MGDVQQVSAVHCVPPTYVEGAGTLSPAVAASVGPRYQLRQVLSLGSVASVYRAYDLVLQRDVAVKADLAGGAAGQSLLREARITARLDHPNIIPLYELLTGPELNGFSMKLICGNSLAEYMGPKSRAMLHADLLRIVPQICSGLAFAHHQDVLHLDLKPDNVLEDQLGHVYLIDWGVALAARRDVDRDAGSKYALGDIRGTFAYMAPEQLTPGIGPVDERTDVHGIGGILFFLLTGMAPFWASTSVREARALRAGASPLLEERLARAGVEAWLGRVVLRALASDSSARYARVENLLDDLRPGSGERQRNAS